MSRNKTKKFKRLLVESLEDRLNLAGNVNVVLSGNTLSITGDAKANEIDIQQISENQIQITGYQTGWEANTQTTVKFNNVIANQHTITLATPVHVKINMGDGDDDVDIQNISSGALSLNADLGKGIDDLYISNATVSGTAGNTINLGGDHDYDRLYISESSATNAALTIKGLGNGVSNIDVVYGTFKGLTVETGNGADDIDIYGVTVNGKASVKSFGGDDDIEYSSNSTTALELITGDGNDDIYSEGGLTTTTLHVNMGNGDDGYYSGGSTVNSTTGTTVIDLGAGDDEVNVENALIQNALQIKTGNGENYVNVSDTEVTGGSLKIDGGSEYDEVELYDVNVTNAGAGNLSVTLGNGTGYLDMEGVVVAKDISITTGNGDDEIILEGVAAQKLSIKASGGENAIDLYAVGSTLDWEWDEWEEDKIWYVESPLTELLVETNGGDDAMYFNNVLATKATVKAGNGANEIYVDNSTIGNLTFTSGNGVDKLDIDGLIVNNLDVKLGAGNDTVNVYSGTFNTTLKVNGEAGDDFLNLLGDEGAITGAALETAVLTSITLVPYAPE